MNSELTETTLAVPGMVVSPFCVLSVAEGGRNTLAAVPGDEKDSADAQQGRGGQLQLRTLRDFLTSPRVVLRSCVAHLRGSLSRPSTSKPSFAATTQGFGIYIFLVAVVAQITIPLQASPDFRVGQ